MTTTSAVPAACAVVVPVIVVGFVVEMVSADPPTETVAPPWNAVPLIVTAVPPAVAPLVGAIELTVGAGATYVKQPAHAPLCASGFVTVTLTDPAAWAVVVPVMDVALIVETLSADPPNETVAPVWNPVPAMLTDVPPALGPLLGVTDATVGAATYVKQPVHVPVCESGFVTITLTRPLACAVVVPVMLVALTVETVSADPPSDTVAPAWNPLPATVTAVPPAAGPLFGLTEATVGAATKVKQPVQVPVCVSGFVTTTFTAPLACAVVVPVIVVGLTVATVRADPPKETVAPLWNPLPVRVTLLPPTAGPLVGVTELTVGGSARYVKQSVQVTLWPSGFVTVTFTVAGACAAAVPLTFVGVVEVTLNADPPSETVAPLWKPVPVIATVVPPAAAPVVGATCVIVGAGATYVKQPEQVPLCVSAFVTTTSTVPEACAVVEPVIAVGLIVATVRADPPKDTVAPAENPVPFTVTEVLPAVGPLDGVTDVTVGAATYVKQPAQLPL